MEIDIIAPALTRCRHCARHRRCRVSAVILQFPTNTASALNWIDVLYNSVRKTRLPKVRDYLDWYLDWYESEHPTTISKARSEMKRFIQHFGHRPIDTIRPVEVEQYKRGRLLDDKAAKETLGEEIRVLKTAFRRGVEWKELDVNPLDSVKAPRGVRSVAVKFYDPQAMRKLYRANTTRAPLWLFLAHTGLRRGEVIGLQKASVVGGRLLVESDPDETGAGRTKSGKWGEVPLNRYALGVATSTGPDRHCA